MVLAASGGALKAMLPAFKAGLGGRVGSGRQQISWIRLGDLVSLIVWALEATTVEGALNAVAPHPVSQADFARALGQAVRRPAVIPAPAWAVKLLFGQMGAETLLADLAVAPRKAREGGFVWSTPDLPAALGAALRE
jgi:NAD dependent epimerase/dehydratase family enzyme